MYEPGKNTRLIGLAKTAIIKRPYRRIKSLMYFNVSGMARHCQQCTGAIHQIQ